MSKCTAAEAVAAMTYWVGYYEKASSSYSQTRAKSAFEKNKGSANYTYAGYKCGTQGQAWCAAQVTTAITEACGDSKDDAKAVMYGVYPYVNCAQVWDAAPNSCKYWSHYQRWTLDKGKRQEFYPKAGDIIVFTDNQVSRSHTGMVYACDNKYVYTIEGNSGNMCRKRSYLLTSSYLYGWIRPDYKESSENPDVPVEQYGKKLSIGVHQLSKGNAGDEVRTLQILLNHYIDAGLEVDGDFGAKTAAAVIKYKDVEWPGSEHNSIVGQGTWERLLGVS